MFKNEPIELLLMVIALIPSHIDSPLRLKLLRQCILSLKSAGIEHIYISISCSTLEPIEILSLSGLGINLYISPVQLSQFQHFQKILENTTSIPIDTVALLIDDDDLVSSEIIDVYKRETSVSDVWVPSRYIDKTTLQRDPCMSFDQLVSNFPAAEVSKLNEISGTIIKMSQLKQFIDDHILQLNYPLLDVNFKLYCSEREMVSTAPLVWQRRWRTTYELSTWKMQWKNNPIDDALVASASALVAVCEQLHDELYELLKTINTVLAKANVTYWIDSGTLLGAIRHNGDFIPWDDDADVTIFKSSEEAFKSVKWPDDITCVQYKPDMWKIFKHTGYPFVDVFTINDKPSSDDLHHYCCSEFQHETLRAENLIGLKAIPFRDSYFPAPCNPKTVLSDRYGPDWMTYAVCVEMHGDRYYGILPMIAQYADGEWFRTN